VSRPVLFPVRVLLKRIATIASLIGLIMLIGAQQAQASSIPVLVTGRMAEALGSDYASRIWAVDETGDLASHEVVMVTSLAQFRAADIPAGTTVMYDLEHWAYTPEQEWEYPVAALRTFVREAHTRGLVTLLAPGFTALRYSLGCHQRKKETATAAYLRCFAPIQTDFLLLQSQGAECTPSAFQSEVAAVATVSPAQVIAELTVVPSTSCITVPILLQDAGAVAGVADGISVWGLGVSARPDVRPDLDQEAMLVAFFAGTD
jgi:hypothetical protein